MPAADQNLEPRVASLETAVKQIAASISNIEVNLQARARTNWGVIIAAVAVAITLVVSIGNSFLAPIRVETEFAKMLFNEERAKRQAATGDIVQLQERNREVETQFAWSRAANSFAFATQQRIIRMLWRREYGEELPELDLIPIGPNGRY